jgi:hypothetical protein
MPEQVGLACLIADLKIIIRNEIQRHGLSPDNFNLDGILSTVELRNGLMRDKYGQMRQECGAAECLEVLAQDNRVTQKTAEDVVYKRK